MGMPWLRPSWQIIPSGQLQELPGPSGGDQIAIERFEDTSREDVLPGRLRRRDGGRPAAARMPRLFNHGILLKVDDVLATNQMVYRDLDGSTEFLPDLSLELERFGHGHLVLGWPEELPQSFRGHEELRGKGARSLFGMPYALPLIVLLIDDQVDFSLRRIEQDVPELVREVDGGRPWIRAASACCVQDGCGNAGLRFLQRERVDPSAR